MELVIAPPVQEHLSPIQTFEKCRGDIEELYARWTDGSYCGRESLFFRNLFEAEVDFLDPVNELTGDPVVLEHLRQLRDELIDQSDLLFATRCDNADDIAERRNAFTATAEIAKQIFALQQPLRAKLEEEAKQKDAKRQRASLLHIRPAISETLLRLRVLLRAAEMDTQKIGETSVILDQCADRKNGGEEEPYRSATEKCMKEMTAQLTELQQSLKDASVRIRQTTRTLLDEVRSRLFFSSPDIIALFEALHSAQSLHQLTDAVGRIRNACALAMQEQSPENASDPASRESKETVRVHIRWMIRRDMPEVLAAETASFECAWSEEDFIRCLRQRNCIGMVAEYDDRVVGFMVYELQKSRIHVLNFAVNPYFRRFGVGSQMIDKLIAKLSSRRRDRIFLEVREHNVPAQLFFKGNGFRPVSVLRNYYDDTTEDAYLMQYRYRSPEELAAIERRKMDHAEKNDTVQNACPLPARDCSPKTKPQPPPPAKKKNPTADVELTLNKTQADEAGTFSPPTEWNPNDPFEEPWTPDRLHDQDRYGLWDENNGKKRHSDDDPEPEEGAV